MLGRIIRRLRLEHCRETVKQTTTRSGTGSYRMTRPHRRRREMVGQAGWPPIAWCGLSPTRRNDNVRRAQHGGDQLPADERLRAVPSFISSRVAGGCRAIPPGLGLGGPRKKPIANVRSSPSPAARRVVPLTGLILCEGFFNSIEPSLSQCTLLVGNEGRSRSNPQALRLFPPRRQLGAKCH